VKNWRVALSVWFVISTIWTGYLVWRDHDVWTNPCAHCLFPPGFARGVALEFVLLYGVGPAVVVLLFGLLTAAGVRLLRRVRTSN
jgi:ABC-type Mn2+/Zn2+ transport system permease subunit